MTTTEQPRIVLRNGLGDGYYDAFDGPGKNATKVGEIYKRKQHYNLRRALTVTSWIVSTPDFPRHRDNTSIAYATRKDAVAALSKHLADRAPASNEG